MLKQFKKKNCNILGFNQSVDAIYFLVWPNNTGCAVNVTHTLSFDIL